MHARAGWVYHSLDLARMRQAANRLVGEHDFSSFRSSQCQAASPVRTLQALDIVQHGDYFLFTFKANAFLHHMVRNLMGAPLYRSEEQTSELQSLMRSSYSVFCLKKKRSEE